MLNAWLEMSKMVGKLVILTLGPFDSVFLDLKNGPMVEKFILPTNFNQFWLEMSKMVENWSF